MPDYFPQPSANALRIAAALDREISLDFKELPIAKAVETLQDRLGVPVVMNRRALEDAGVTAETPITFQVSNVRAKTALAFMFGQLDLHALEQEELVLITTADLAEEARFARVYPVGDLVTDDVVVVRWDARGNDAGMHESTPGRGPVVLPMGDYDSLIDLISIAVRPQTWDNHPEIVELPEAKCLVVLQTREVHDEILELLRALRAAKQIGEAMEGK